MTTVLAPQPLARNTDPATSDMAAASLDLGTLSAQQTAILTILHEHPDGLDDHQLAAIYTDRAIAEGWPTTFADSIRKRRADLTRFGHVTAAGTHTSTRTRRVMTIWKATR